MNPARRDEFIQLWNKYFPGADLPITFYYTNEPKGTEPPDEKRCFIAQLAAVRKGRSLHFNLDSVMCPGGKRYLGFSQTLMPNFEYFLSCGIPGELEGERYKKSPELVSALMERAPEFVAPAPYVVFKRWDRLEPENEPKVVVFFAPPDVLSGLFTLAGFEESDPQAVIAPFCAGCASIVQYPYLESQQARPRAVLGMFDVSARPWVPAETLSFAIPMTKFARMIDDMDESFLITGSWQQVKARL
ncbi:MAG: DUF169 domain-containing protein [Candidatus Hydrogenedentota bacterium]